MRRPAVSSVRSPARSLVLGTLLALALSLLVACSGPVAGVRIDVGSAAVAVLRGGSVDVDLTLTRTGGATGPVVLSVAGLPANVSASFAPAALDGAALKSVLTLTAAVGAAEGSSSVTITAAGGSLADDTPLALEVTSLAVSGRIEGLLGDPVGGVTVSSQGATTVTDAEGGFELEGLSVPYDLTASSPIGTGAVHVFEGLTAAAPVIVPSFVLALGAAPTPMQAGLTGSVLRGATVAAEHQVIVCVEGLERATFGCDKVGAGETEYAVTASWFGPTTAQARVHALHGAFQADGTPMDFLGYESFDVVLVNGNIVEQDLALETVASLTLRAELVPSAGQTLQEVRGSVRFGRYLSMPVFTTATVNAYVDVPMPSVANASFDLLATATGPAGTSRAWVVDEGATASDVLPPAPMQLTMPADGALGVDLTTPFGSFGPAATRTYRFTGAGPSLAITTTRTSVTLPDLVTAGFAIPAGATYGWSVVGHGDGPIGEPNVGGLADYLRPDIQWVYGGPGFGRDGTFTSPAVERAFTFAP
ncbi:MAG: hypothetical protein P1P87_11105 [Trueperaceae bacterium]|nr:hypothetical protein [Trueperaceae bacterium]